MKKLSLIIFVILLSLQAFAQTKAIKGTVKDSSGDVLAGVSVIEKGTGNGVITDLDGVYSIHVQKGATLVFSCIGFSAKESLVGDEDIIDLVLENDTQMLSEVVLIGYGTQKKSTMTSSIAQVSAKDVNKQISTNVASALQGRAAGVDVIQQAGIAGADVKIVVRGAASLTATEPLYIVDGVFTNNGLTTINPADIENIEILKDGSAAAIYGSRAANGVVLITTKGGKSGSVKVDANLNYSIQQVTNIPDFLNASQWREFANMVSDNSGLARAPENVSPSDPGIDTNWAKAWLQFAPILNADAAISGGNKNGNYSFSLGYLDQKGLTLNSGYKKYNARANSSWKIGRFFVSENFSVVYRKKKPTATFNIGMPTLPLVDAQGRYSSWGPEYYIETENKRRNNPMAGLFATDQYTQYFDVMGGVLMPE